MLHTEAGWPTGSWTQHVCPAVPKGTPDCLTGHLPQPAGAHCQLTTLWLLLAAGQDHLKGVALSPEDDPETIHIFTVASGHMYERLQKIMILSVIQNTRWVLVNSTYPGGGSIWPC